MTEPKLPKPVRRYKTILARVLDSRPSGTRQRLAAVLGTNRSFVSQISSVAYRVAIPAHHVNTILDICHFSPADRAEFLKAYAEAHPNHHQETTSGFRTVELSVVDLGNARSNRLVDEALRDMARQIARIVQDRNPV